MRAGLQLLINTVAMFAIGYWIFDQYGLGRNPLSVQPDWLEPSTVCRDGAINTHTQSCSDPHHERGQDAKAPHSIVDLLIAGEWGLLIADLAMMFQAIVVISRQMRGYESTQSCLH